ncbi:hypothetical protein [Streptomyces sp. WAC08241]|uniref:hypothetical protein n=1 Tax=Streptomyces sp. WAC08241 TaxID=2487421 RepID=UPI000F77414A|nr:hypothetical protein [Streptomyces sp. WAC08241]RSS39020.1 hypothetical protein EF906_19805 [Streptomyces sp. WAC08241]
MTDPIKQDPIITTKDMHATSEPAVGAITAKITGPADETVTTKDMHATSEPAIGAITEKVTGDEEHVAKPAT